MEMELVYVLIGGLLIGAIIGYLVRMVTQPASGEGQARMELEQVRNDFLLHLPVADIDQLKADWRAHLAAHNVAIEMEVNWEQGGTSIYFRDPAGNSVELAPLTLWGRRAGRGHHWRGEFIIGKVPQKPAQGTEG